MCPALCSHYGSRAMIPLLLSWPTQNLEQVTISIESWCSLHCYSWLQFWKVANDNSNFLELLLDTEFNLYPLDRVIESETFLWYIIAKGMYFFFRIAFLLCLFVLFTLVSYVSELYHWLLITSPNISLTA